MPKGGQFSVGVKFKDLELGVTVTAESLEQAIAKVKVMKTFDILRDYDYYNDGERRVFSEPDAGRCRADL